MRIVGDDKLVIPRAERGVVAAVTAQAGVVADLGPVQRRRIATGRPLVEDLMQVSGEIVSKFQRAGQEGVFDGFLSELLIGTIFEDGEQIVFHCAHNWR